MVAVMSSPIKHQYLRGVVLLLVYILRYEGIKQVTERSTFGYNLGDKSPIALKGDESHA